jgi:hypothetical protein
MQASYVANGAGKVALVLEVCSLDNRLRQRIRAIEEKYCDLLVGGPANVDRTMHPVGRLIPARLSDSDFNAIGLSPIPVLDRQHSAAYHHGYSMIGINVPWSGCARFQNQPLEEGSTALANCFGGHWDKRRCAAQLDAAQRLSHAAAAQKA